MKYLLYEYNKYQRAFSPLYDWINHYAPSIVLNPNKEHDVAIITHASYCKQRTQFYEEAVSNGIKLINSLNNPVLLDSSDSTSLVFIKDFLDKSKSKIGLKNYLTREHGLFPFGKKFFSDYADQDTWMFDNNPGIKEILPTNSSLYKWTNLQNFQSRHNRDIDVNCIIGTLSKPNIMFGHNDAELYNRMRNKVKQSLASIRGLNIDVEKKPYPEYIRSLANSKICVSPFGMGEVCLRDIEAIRMGCILLKPRMDYVVPTPDIYNDSTCVLYDDLEKGINFALNNLVECREKTRRAQRILDLHNNADHIKGILSNANRYI